MSTNAALSARFEQMARLLELLGEDKFRVNAHARAARTLDSLSTDVAPLAADRKALLELEGVGPRVADKIIEFVTTGAIQEHLDLLARVPPGLLDILQVPGVGPKTAKALWDTLNVTCLEDLKRAIADGTILQVPRMGEKAVQKILAGIAIAAEGAARLPLGLAMPLAEHILSSMRRVPGITQAAYAGSLRRGKDSVGDLDILVCSTDPDAAQHAFTTLPGVRQILVSGSTKSSVRMSIDPQADGSDPAAPPPAAINQESIADSTDDDPAATTPVPAGRTIQVDLKVVPPASFGAALLYFTGSKDHNIRLRERSLKRGLTLNEYGLYPNDDHPDPPHKRNIPPVAGETEQAVYRALGLAYIPPELREDNHELDAAQLDAAGSHKLPTLVQLADIRAELHAHTTASDGRLSIQDLAAAAQRRGFHTLAVTDHSKSSAIAGGLSVERLRAHVAEIRRIAKQTTSITILAGSEVDILADGSLDYDDDTLALLDVVVASPHASLSQDPAAATKRLLRAMAHPRVNILGHPTGRRIGQRPGLSPALPELLTAARQHNVALEINAHWLRLDLRDTHVRAAVDSGCLIAINCDVHDPDNFDNLRYGLLTARRGWLTPDRCINCWPPAKLHKWLFSKH